MKKYSGLSLTGLCTCKIAQISVYKNCDAHISMAINGNFAKFADLESPLHLVPGNTF